MLNFTRNDIKNETDTGSYHRGLSYFERDMVVSLKVDFISEQSIALYSEVEGRDYNPYEQMVLIDRNYGAIDINGQCTCPVGFNCKHVVASCLEYLAKSKDSAGNNVDVSMYWLNDFLNASEHNVALADTADNEFISYALMPSNTDSGLAVKILKNRCLKKGGRGKGRQINVYDITNDYIDPGFLQDIDLKIAQMLEAQNEYTWGEDELTLSGDLGALCLFKMLGTGRCHWLSPQNPVLQMGESRELQLGWKDEKNGDKRL